MDDRTATYTVLARRFRPQTFGDVVGQDHVGQAIRNAIRAGRVAHAYLFTGARGVGKTSTARIFAKALNCPNVVDGAPCNACDVCDRVSAGVDVDVSEIDGASNRGIDDVRALRANVNVKSMRSKYKVYIIDEVHMLTKEAFNALLKTLEEPPPNVKFVFCTTEPNKVPDTILSRCQRFDFGTIATTSIATRLRQIAEAEGIEVDSEAVDLVARRAAGSMRDSQSLFDQLLAFGEEHVTVADVHRLLGTAPDDRVVNLVAALIDRQRAAALQLLNEALDQGVQLGALSDQLLHYLRDLLVTAIDAEGVPLLSVAESLRPTLKDQSARWGLATISAAMQILAETKGRMQRVNYGRALMDLALVRMSMLEDLDQLSELAARVRSGTPAVSGGTPAIGAPGRAASTPLQIGGGDRPARSDTLSGGGGSAVKKNSEGAVAAPVLASGGSSTALLEVEPMRLEPDTVDAFWAQLLTVIPDGMAGHFKNASHVAVQLASSGPNVLEITFPRSYLFSKNYCESGDRIKKLQLVAERMAGHPLDIALKVEAVATAPVSVRASAPAVVADRRRPASMEGDPFVQQAVAIFGGIVVDVRESTQAASDAED